MTARSYPLDNLQDAESEKLFSFERVSPAKVIAVLVARSESILRELQEELLTRGWSEMDSDELVDNLEEWMLTQPLTEAQEKEIPPGTSERMYEKLLARLKEEVHPVENI